MQKLRTLSLLTKVQTAAQQDDYYMEPGSRYCVPATTNHGEWEVMYIAYKGGTGSVTATSHNVAVPYISSADWDGYTFTGDKTDLVDDLGKFSAILLGDTWTAATCYGFAVIRGKTYAAPGTTAIAQGNAIISTTAGTDKTLEALKDGLSAYNTMTSADIGKITGVFAHATDTITAATSLQPLQLHGF